jgi:hypothetical protein
LDPGETKTSGEDEGVLRRVDALEVVKEEEGQGKEVVSSLQDEVQILKCWIGEVVSKSVSVSEHEGIMARKGCRGGIALFVSLLPGVWVGQSF